MIYLCNFRQNNYMYSLGVLKAFIFFFSLYFENVFDLFLSEGSWYFYLIHYLEYISKIYENKQLIQNNTFLLGAKNLPGVY